MEPQEPQRDAFAAGEQGRAEATAATVYRLHGWALCSAGRDRTQVVL